MRLPQMHQTQLIWSRWIKFLNDIFSYDGSHPKKDLWQEKDIEEWEIFLLYLALIKLILIFEIKKYASIAMWSF